MFIINYKIHCFFLMQKCNAYINQKNSSAQGVSKRPQNITKSRENVNNIND
jgi:hypothetical protein